MKRCLVLINKPYMLIEFAYLYTYLGDCEYDVVIEGVSERMTEELFEKCKALNVFRTIKTSCTSFKHQSFDRKIKLFIRLFILAIFRNQRVFYKELLKKDDIDMNDYDKIIVPNDHSMLASSMIGSCGYNHEIIMLEEGTVDYEVKHICVPFKNIFSINEWIAFFLLKMGYSNLNYHYVNKNFPRCIKYCSNPTLLRYQGYKEVRKLFEFNGEEKEIYLELISRIYELHDADILKEMVDAVIFTNPFTEDYCVSDDWFVNGCSWLQEELDSKKVLIKRHPRDTFTYSFPKLDVCEMFAQVPGELLVGELENAEVIFLFPSTILLNVMNVELNYKIIYFNSIKSDLYQKRFWEYCEILKIPKENIVIISEEEQEMKMTTRRRMIELRNEKNAGGGV